MFPSRILLADADPSYRRRLTDVLQDRAVPARVDGVPGAAEALDRLARDSYDLLILTRDLADGDGVRFLSEAREERPDLPILVLMASEDSDYVARARAVGATEVRIQPPRLEDLCDLVVGVLQGGPSGARAPEARIGRAPRRPAKRTRGRSARSAAGNPGRRRRASDWLPEDLSFVRTLLDATDLLVAVFDLDGRILFFNRSCQILTGHGTDLVRGRLVWDFLLVPEEAAEVQRHFARLRDEQGAGRHEHHWIARDGSRWWIGWSHTLLKGEDGRPRFVLGTGINLTPVRDAEQNAGLLRAIVSSSHDAIIAQALDGRVLHWNAGAERTFGYRAGEVLGRTLPEIFVPTPPCSVQGIAERLQRGETCSTQETQCRRKDGRAISVLCTPSPIFNSQRQLVGISLIARDIGDLRRTNRRKEAEEKTTRVLADAVTLAAAAPRLLEVLCESFEWPVGELWGVDDEAGLLRHIHTWHRPGLRLSRFVEATRHITLTPEVTIPGRIWTERRSVWVADVSGDSGFVRAGLARTAGLRACFGFPVRARDRVVGVLVFFNFEPLEPDDELMSTMEAIGGHIGLLLERNRAVRTMAGQESRMRAIVETAADGIFTIDERGTIDSFNPAAERLFGYRADEVIGRNVSQLMPEPHRSELAEHVARYLTTGDKRVIGKDREMPGLRKDGTTFPLSLSVSEMYVDGRRMFTGNVRDLSGMKAMQDEVVRTRSLAAIGEASAAIAHEIRNPLAAISGPLQIIGQDLPPGDSRREIVGEVLAQVKRLDAVVRQLLALSRPWIPKKELGDLRELVQKMMAMISRQNLFPGVRMTLEAPAPLILPVDPALFEQVLWNLLLNAAQAMPAGGAVRILLEETRDSASAAIVDDGPGIPPEVQAKLFQPFFTTKASGTGLGLATCRKIMDAHGGSLRLASKVGAGTAVTLTFPK